MSKLISALCILLVASASRSSLLLTVQSTLGILPNVLSSSPFETIGSNLLAKIDSESTDAINQVQNAIDEAKSTYGDAAAAVCISEAAAYIDDLKKEVEVAKKCIEDTSEAAEKAFPTPDVNEVQEAMSACVDDKVGPLVAKVPDVLQNLANCLEQTGVTTTQPS